MSTLDARIRKLAREEATKLSLPKEQAEAGVFQPQPSRIDELETEVADLRTRLEKLENANTPAKRTARKTTDPS